MRYICFFQTCIDHFIYSFNILTQNHAFIEFILLIKLSIFIIIFSKRIRGYFYTLDTFLLTLHLNIVYYQKIKVLSKDHMIAISVIPQNDMQIFVFLSVSQTCSLWELTSVESATKLKSPSLPFHAPSLLPAVSHSSFIFHHMSYISFPPYKW